MDTIRDRGVGFDTMVFGFAIIVFALAIFGLIYWARHGGIELIRHEEPIPMGAVDSVRVNVKCPVGHDEMVYHEIIYNAQGKIESNHFNCVQCGEVFYGSE